MNIQAALVRSILEQYPSYLWRVLGLGFISTELGDVGRIHVWDSTLTEPRVSTAHTHTWALHSTVISGELINQRFDFTTEAPTPGHVPPAGLPVPTPYLRSALQTGQGGGLVGDADEGWLVPMLPEVYGAGQSYNQACNEIHRSLAQDGTVTLVQRKPQTDERCFVYWPKGTLWGDAKPRPAKMHEVERAVGWALMRWHP